jgi:acetyltransferase-like isoleucine patch superfamily enzyme
VIVLDLLWWAGWIWFLGWTALPFLLVPASHPFPTIVLAALLAPFSALVGMGLIHRLLPRSEAGRFRLFTDRRAVRWAMKAWAPSVYLGVFQPVLFMSEGFQRLVLRVFGACLGPGALVTSRTTVREPHHLRIGAGSLIGEFVHLACSYQPRRKLLVVGDIVIGDEVLVGAHSVLAPGVRIGNRCVLEHAVSVGAHCILGDEVRIGGGTVLYTGVEVGDRAVIGKGCIIPAGRKIPSGAVLSNGLVLPPAERDDAEGSAA